MPFSSLEFRFPWRPYQLRVIDAIHEHLQDQKIHIVAAPGAGKTCLGLEIFRLLAKPAVVLSPTRVIRDQWLERLSDFTDTVSIASFTSKQLEKPAVLTSVTYQALHSKVSVDKDDGRGDPSPLSNSELNCFIELLKQKDIGVLILDEAHHLRAEWWKALDYVCKALPDLTLVSLTATPPYDVSPQEWQRYEALCGPIDEEISIPELVKAETLCPHQDYIWAVNASATEKALIKKHDQAVSTLCQSLFNHEQFLTIVRSHSWLDQGVSSKELIKNPNYAIALMVFLHARGEQVPGHLLTMMDFSINELPELGRHHWQILLQHLLFQSGDARTDPDHAEFLEKLKKQLRGSGLLFRRELSIEHSRRIDRSLSLSPQKIRGCVSIHRLERRHRGEQLRQVFLTDYIRDDELANEIESGERDLGAWPVFKKLTSVSPVRDQIAMLSGRLTIIPAHLQASFSEAFTEKEINYIPMGNQNQYLKVTAPLNKLTSRMTELLNAGTIKVLVGTRSLLGEGWDAPSINSLILASSVGSFMQTNQMRGRAIRINRENPQKISSIWHLVAVNPESGSGLGDLSELHRRFETFVGLSEHGKLIEAGFDRVKTVELIANDERMRGWNRLHNWITVRRYRRVEKVAERWHAALVMSEHGRVIPSVETEADTSIRFFYLIRSFRHLLFQMFTVFVIYFMASSQLLSNLDKGLYYASLIAAASVPVIKTGKTVAALKSLFRFLPVDGPIKQMGKALLKSLIEAGHITTPSAHMSVVSRKQGDGIQAVYLIGASFYESSMFADCMAELLAPIESPRYIISRSARFMGAKRKDYHAVPARLGVKNKFAQQFLKNWRELMGEAELIYTRNEVGRDLLLKAKARSFSSLFSKEVKRQNQWR